MNNKNFMLIGLAIALVGCANPIHQVIVDAKVDELCAKDGKAIVYERDSMPRNKAKFALDKKYVKPSDTHYWVSRATPLKNARSGDVPNITRWNAKLYRIQDNLLLGEYTYYWRSGGDFLPGHPSVYRCKTNSLEALLTGVFALSGDEK